MMDQQRKMFWKVLTALLVLTSLICVITITSSLLSKPKKGEVVDLYTPPEKPALTSAESEEGENTNGSAIGSGRVVNVPVSPTEERFTALSKNRRTPQRLGESVESPEEYTDYEPGRVLTYHPDDPSSYRSLIESRSPVREESSTPPNIVHSPGSITRDPSYADNKIEFSGEEKTSPQDPRRSTDIEAAGVNRRAPIIQQGKRLPLRGPSIR